LLVGFPAVRPGKLLSRIVGGSTTNVASEDFCALMEALGFELDRTRGSPRLYYYGAIRKRLTVQPLKDGDAKPYQIRQLLRLVEQYNLEVRGG
jgi:predicted RNA binding protein YcfA (HicA-like mRNA interferase family)